VEHKHFLVVVKALLLENLGELSLLSLALLELGALVLPP
jgi:hypothetical protein